MLNEPTLGCCYIWLSACYGPFATDLLTSCSLEAEGLFVVEKSLLVMGLLLSLVMLSFATCRVCVSVCFLFVAKSIDGESECQAGSPECAISDHEKTRKSLPVFHVDIIRKLLFVMRMGCTV
jgi:hypothetical protein